MNNENNEYEEYLDKWLNGIESEIHFWDEFMKTRGGNCGHSEERAKREFAYEKPFVHDNDLENTEDVKYLDVGSGPFSRYGSKSERANLIFTACDPLASVYKILKNKHNIKTKVQPITAMVENLSSVFSENEFDIVHMSNALDHSFDPILGLWQMLYVCKVGGKIILRHHKNEAENENYQGFHQWNLNVENDKFVIWRKNNKIDVQEVLKCCAEIEETKTEKEPTGWEYNKVVIRKKDKAPLHFNENYPLLLEKMVENICHLNLKIYETQNKPNSEHKCEIQNKPKSEHKVYKFFGIKIKIRK